jgi:hypothetical protein
MAGVVLMLGPVVFQDFEIPSGINFGGRQLLAVHQLTDGRRVVDSIGPSESEISFSGTFSGTDATSRARMLNSLRVVGGELSLTWDVFCYTVVLSHFGADYENPVWIPYGISCTVMRDEAATMIPSAVSLGNSILTDLDAAAAQCDGFGLDFTAVRRSVTSPDATTLGSAAYAATQSGISLMQSAINIQIASAETALRTTVLSNPTSAGSLVTHLVASTTAAQQLASLTSANAYVGRTARNLLHAST